MRLHRLVFSGVGPFADRQEIDFARLTQSGLFLLEGPTGSGKTTVIDAIVFALYGSLADVSADKRRLRSDHTAATEESFVDLVFEVSSGVYRVSRTPQHDRAKRRGEGTRTVQSTAKLWRLSNADNETGEIVSTNVAEASAEVTRLIGLTREQFVQTVVLPQGQFAAFLRAGNDQRKQLLQQIFGTDVYQRLVQELKARRQAAESGVASLAGAVRQATHDLSFGAGLGEEGAAELAAAVEDLVAGAGREQMESLTKVVVERTSTAFQDARREAEETAAAAVAAVESAQSATALAKDAVTRRTLTVKLEELEAAAAARRQDAERLETARRASGLRPLIGAAEAAGAAEAEARAAVEALGLPAETSDEAPWQAAAEQAVLAESKAGERLVAAQRLETARLEETRAATARDAAGQRLKEAEQNLATALSAVETAARDEPRLRVEAVRLKDLETRLEAHRAAETRSAEAQCALAAAKTTFTAAQADEATARTVRLAGIAGEMAMGLETGRPCPVCGSVEHPAPAALAAGHVTIRDVERAEGVRRAAESAYEAAAAAARDAALTAAGLGGSTGEAESGAVAEELATTLRDLADLGDPRELAAAAEAGTALAAQAKTAFEAAETALAEAHDRTVALAGRSSGGDLAEAAAALDAAEKARREAEAELAAVRGALEARRAAAAAQASLESAGSEAGFASAAAVLAASLSVGELKELDRTLKTAEAELISVTERLKDPALTRAGGDPDELLVAADAASQTASLAQQSDKDAAAALVIAERTSRLVRAAAEQLRSLTAEFLAAKQDAAAVTRVADLTTAGPANLRGVDLPTYVLIRRFEEVIAAANDRLRPMSAGRYLLEHSDTKEEARQRHTGLALRVRDNQTGEARPPKTLSGGETFYVSLALALGLADVVTAEAGGAGLETLFVDEGFGSLDGESLEAVLTQLVRLRDGGRVVGLVSHVEALKQAIPERIEARPLPGGGSTLRVRA